MWISLVASTFASTQPELVERPATAPLHFAVSSDFFEADDNPLALSAPKGDLDGATRASRIVGTTGLVMSIAGAPVAVAGTFLVFVASFGGSTEAGLTGLALFGAGGVALLAGPPMLLGGTMRTARILQNHGLQVDRTLGWVGWGLYGGSWLTSIGGLAFDPILVFSTPLMVASIVLGGLQSLKNLKARKSANRLGVHLEDDAHFRVAVVPWVDQQALLEKRTPAQGLAIAGAF